MHRICVKMGVWGLKKHIVRFVENGYFPVNIKGQIENWKREHQNGEPLIIFDLICLSYHLDKYDYFTGGRHNLFIEDIRTFFKTIKEFGAKLVFFIDGPLQDDKYETWCDRHDLKYAVMMKVFEDIFTNTCNMESLKKNHTNLPLISTVISAVINVATEFGEFVKSYYFECDMELVDYAVKNNALAVIADDTDFLIFKGDWKFWSANDMNMQSMTTKEYNKRGLREHLKLSVEQMPLFAALYTKGYMHIKSKVGFNKALQYIRQYPNELQDSEIAKIVNDIYENNLQSSIECDFQNIEKSFKDTIKSYKIVNTSGLPPLEDELLINAFNDIHGYIFEILENLPIKITTLYFDYSKDDFKNYFDLIERLVCRQMGVLLKHKNEPDLTRTIITKKSHDEKHQQYQVKPEYPIIDIPENLNQLLFDRKDKKIRHLKFQLLCWIVTDVVKPTKLKKIPKKYLVAVLTLVYLRENDQISLAEADAILMSIKVEESRLEEFQPLNILNERAFRIAFLFTKLYGHIKRCLCYVGLSDLIADLQFDGLCFHTIYARFGANQIDETEYADSIKHLEKYRIYKKSD